MKDLLLGLEFAELERGKGEEREREVVGDGSGGDGGGEGGGDGGAAIRVISGFWRGFGSEENELLGSRYKFSRNSLFLENVWVYRYSHRFYYLYKINY